MPSTNADQPTPGPVKVVDTALVGFIVTVSAVLGAGFAGLF